jgi:hypothetical protein
LSENAHFLSKKGKEWIGSSKEWKWTPLIDHYLLRNEYLIQRKIDLGQCMLEPIFKLNKEDILRPDAWYFTNNQFYFLEIDRVQKMKDNVHKIKMYRTLRDEKKYPTKYGVFPTIVFVTLTEYRAKELRKNLNGLKSEVIQKEDIY